jgi:hypothetical protein
MIEVPKKVQHDLTFHFVESMDEVLALAFAGRARKARAAAKRRSRRAPRPRPIARRPAAHR